MKCSLQFIRLKGSRKRSKKTFFRSKTTKRKKKTFWDEKIDLRPDRMASTCREVFHLWTSTTNLSRKGDLFPEKDQLCFLNYYFSSIHILTHLGIKTSRKKVKVGLKNNLVFWINFFAISPWAMIFHPKCVLSPLEMPLLRYS